MFKKFPRNNTNNTNGVVYGKIEKYKPSSLLQKDTSVFLGIL